MNWLNLYWDLAKTLPELWKQFNDKRIVKIEYIDFAIPTCNLLGGVLTTTRGKENIRDNYVPSMSEYTAASITAMLIDTKVDVKYITDIHSLEDVPASLTCKELNINSEAGVFMLPNNSISHPIEGPIGYLAYARIKQGRPLLVGYSTGEVETLIAPALKDTLLFFFTSHTCKPYYPSYHYHIPIDMSMDLDTVMENRKIANFRKGTFRMENEDPDASFNAKMANLGCRLLYQQHKTP